MKKLICTILVLISFGCAKRAPLKPEVVYFPQLQEVTTAEVGENMFSKVYAIFHSNNLAVLLNEDDREKYRVSNKGRRFGELDGVKCALFNNRHSLFDYNCNGEFTHLRNGDELEKPVKYKLIHPPPTITIVQDSFKREVIYQGKINNKIKISFREFYGHNGKFMIRDAYTQSVEYELDNNGKTLIGFKGLRLKVLNATNLKITYSVIEDFK